ncbi:MAG: hypothetical protein WD768_05855 [Phycisphaeraceae bacterium]
MGKKSVTTTKRKAKSGEGTPEKAIAIQMRQYQEYLENLLNTRLNFFLVFFGLVIGGAMSSENPLKLRLMLTIGTLVTLPVALAIARAQLKMELAFNEARKDLDDPLRIIDDMANGRFPPSMRKWIGYWVPLLCVLVLIAGTVSAWHGAFDHSASIVDPVTTAPAVTGTTPDATPSLSAMQLLTVAIAVATLLATFWVLRLEFRTARERRRTATVWRILDDCMGDGYSRKKDGTTSDSAFEWITRVAGFCREALGQHAERLILQGFDDPPMIENIKNPKDTITLALTRIHDHIAGKVVDGRIHPDFDESKWKGWTSKMALPEASSVTSP